MRPGALGSCLVWGEAELGWVWLASGQCCSAVALMVRTCLHCAADCRVFFYFQCSECNLQGDNQFSQLGTGDNVNSTTPVAVAGGRAFRYLTCGLGFTCALDSEDQAWCWGERDALSLTVWRRRRVLVGQHKLG